MFYSSRRYCYTQDGLHLLGSYYKLRGYASHASSPKVRDYLRRPIRKTFADRLLASVSGMSLRNGGRPMVNWWIRFTSPLVRSWTGGRVRVIYLFVREVSRLGRKSGLAFTASYLKAASVYLMQSVGGMRVEDCCALGPKVARTRGGLPVIIDSLDRVEIRKGNRTIIRFWLTLLNLYRVLEWEMTLKPSKLSTIIEEGDQLTGDLIVELGRFFTESFWPALQKLVGKTDLLSSLGELTQKGKPPLWTNFAKGLTAAPYAIEKVSSTSFKGTPSTAVDSIVDAAHAWRNPVNRKGFGYLKEWCTQTGNLLGGFSQDWTFDSTKLWQGLNLLADQVPSKRPDKSVRLLTLGRLALKREAAGKIRVFAIVDCFTQWLLKPLHKAIFAVLKRIPSDGTFDQLRPVRFLLKRSSTLFSYDLSAATDRLPVQVQEQLLHRVLGLHGAWHWRELLATRLFALPKGVKVHFRRERKKFLPPQSRGTLGQWVTSYVDEWIDKVFYAVGQPMGALSSWAMLALTHHALVQYAFYKSQMSKGLRYYWFRLYAVLGDDVIIGKESVASEYMKVMTALGVRVGIAKSLVSYKKVGEFAKRFFIPKDASAIPVKESLSALSSLPALVEFVRKYRLSPSQVMKFSGYGYKRIGGTTAPFLSLPPKARVIFLALSHPDGAWPRPIATWLGARSLVSSQTLKPSFWDWFKDFEVKRLTAAFYGVYRKGFPNPFGPNAWHADPFFIRAKVLNKTIKQLDLVSDLLKKFRTYAVSPSLFYLARVVQDKLTEAIFEGTFEIRTPEHRSAARMKGLSLWSSALGHLEYPPKHERGRNTGPVKPVSKKQVKKAEIPPISIRSLRRRIDTLVGSLPCDEVVYIPPRSWSPGPEAVQDSDPANRSSTIVVVRSAGLAPGVSPIKLSISPLGGIDLSQLERLKASGSLVVSDDLSHMLPYEKIRYDSYRTSDCGWELYYPDWLLTSRVDPVSNRFMPVRQSRGFGQQDWRVWLPLSHPRSLWNGWYDWKGDTPYCALHLPVTDRLYESDPLPLDGEMILAHDTSKYAKAYADVSEFKIRFEGIFGIDGWGLLNSPTPRNKKLFLSKYGGLIKSLPRSNPKTLLRARVGPLTFPVTQKISPVTR